MDLRTLSDARVSARALYALFCRQLADARRYGHGSWMLARWTEDVWYGWGTGMEVADLRTLIEATAHVRVVGIKTGLRVTTSRQGMPQACARALSAPLGSEQQPVLPAMRSMRANTM